MPNQYPLDWPAGYDRTPLHSTSKFKGSISENYDFLHAELVRFGATDIVISTSVPLNSESKPYSNFNRGSIKDYGVAAYYKLKGQDRVFCCDYWDSVQDNMKAIAKTIDNMRGIARYNVNEVFNRMTQGFAALPEKTVTNPYIVLSIPENATEDQVISARKVLLLKYHPDRPVTGDSAKYQEVEAAYREIMKKLKK